MRSTMRIALALAFVGAVAVAGVAVGEVQTPEHSPGGSRSVVRDDRVKVRRDDRVKVRRDDRVKRREARGNRAHRDGPRGRRLVHGEMKVQRGDGFVTIITDQGTVTAVDTDARRVTIERADGVTVTVTLNDRTRIVKDRERATIDDIEVGDRARTVRVEEGDRTFLRAIRVRSAG